MKKNRTFRKKRGANNGRLNRYINSTYKMKGGARGQWMTDIISRFRRQPQHSDEVPPNMPPPPGVPPPPSPVIGRGIYRQIHPNYPPISELHFKNLERRAEQESSTPSQLFFNDVKSLSDRLEHNMSFFNSRYEQITKDKTMSVTKRDEITREFVDNIKKAMNNWLQHGDFDHTDKQIDEALRTAYRKFESEEQRNEVDVYIQHGDDFDNNSVDGEEIKPLSSPRRTSLSRKSPIRSLSRKSRRSPQPQPPPPPPPSRTNSRANRREKWEQEWRMLTGFPGTIIYPNKKAEKMPLLGARPKPPAVTPFRKYGRTVGTREMEEFMATRNAKQEILQKAQQKADQKKMEE